MRARLVCLVAVIPACAVISGLDGIHVTFDAGSVEDATNPPADATIDGIVMDQQAPEALIDTGIDAGPGTKCTDGTATLSCGALSTCCVKSSYDGGAGSAICRKTPCSFGEVTIRCSVRADCPDAAGCCARRVGTVAQYMTVECSATCVSPNVWFCDPKNGTADCLGKACNPSVLLPGYYACSP